MTTYNARVSTSAVGYADPKMRVLSRDEADLTTIGSDYIFDFSVPACYAGGALPETNAPIPAAGFVNLARDVQPGLAGIERGAALLKPAAGATLPVFDGKGLRFVPGATNGLALTKAGVDGNRILQPRPEGLVDFVEIVVARRTAGGLCYLTNVNGGGGGMAVYADSAVRGRENDALLGYAGLNALTIVAKIVRFNAAAGTSTIRAIFGSGGSPMMADDAVAGRPVANYTDGSAYSFAAIGGSDVGNTGAFAGTIYRVSREYIARSTLTDSDVLAQVRRLATYAAARFS